MSNDTPLYTKTFLRHYGEQLTREEIRLVQASRGLSASQREGLLTLVTHLASERTRLASDARRANLSRKRR